MNKKIIKQLFFNMKNIYDLIDLLNYVSNNIYTRFFVENLIKQNNYKIFYIPKKLNKGYRKIYAPKTKLQELLKDLNKILQISFYPNNSMHGFLKNRSILTNASLHINKNYVFNLDLKDFFPSISYKKVKNSFKKKPFNFNDNIATLLSDLVCVSRKFLPQGAPSSPIISNIICDKLDRRLFNLTQKYNVNYSRYADDITFSSEKFLYKFNDYFLQTVFLIIEEEGFNINHRKIRLQHKNQRQEVTGIIVNEKLNVSKKFINELRILIHILKQYQYEAQTIFENDYQKKNPKVKNIPNIYNVIEGKLSYLKLIKGENSSTYLTLFNKYIQIKEFNQWTL